MEGSQDRVPPTREDARLGGLEDLILTPVDGVEVFLAAADEKRALRELYLAEYGGGDIEFVCARRAQEGAPLGHLRVKLGYDLLRYDNLDPAVLPREAPGAAIDIGGHTRPATIGRRQVHAALWAFLMQLIVGRGVRYVYAQCRPWSVARFSRYGFRPCSPCSPRRAGVDPGGRSPSREAPWSP